MTRLGGGGGLAVWNLLNDQHHRERPTSHAAVGASPDLPQKAPADARSLTEAVARAATRAWRRAWPDSFFLRIWGDRMPRPVPEKDREAAVDVHIVHQLRVGHWSRSRQYLHRIGRLPSPACARCRGRECPAELCLVCREEADTPGHVLLRCPCLAAVRLRILGTIYST